MKITKYLIGGLAALALVGCKDKMRELNTNPETIGETDPRYMFMNAMADLDYSSRGAIQYRASSEGQMMQYFVNYQGAANGTYCDVQGLSYSSPGQIGLYYDWLYSVGYKMVLLQTYLNDNLTETEALQYQDLRAMAGIMQIYHAFRVFQNYGAAVYSDGFKAITEGITTPVYDIFSNEVYESLDDELAGYIAVLEQKKEGQSEVGIYDPIYGYKVSNAAKTAPEARTDYDAQRTLWTKFANSYRLYMAWIMKAADPARFDKVLAETNGKWFETAADGAYTHVNGGGSNNAVYNSDGPNEVSVLYAVSDNFISYLKELDDPRLPLLARANSLYAANEDLEWIARFFPDSLENRMVYDKETKTWSLKSWNGVFDFEADPMLAYQGMSPNPYDYEKAEPGQFWGYRTVTFRFYCPGYVPGDDAGNKAKAPWTVVNPNDPTDTDEVENPSVSYTFEIASRPQGRYVVSCGGKKFSNDVGDSGANGYDGSTSDSYSYFYRTPLYTYPEFCFMMAYLTLDGVATGKTADAWYEAALTEAMKELQADAIRYDVQVATNPAAKYDDVVVNPQVEGINDAGVYSITDKIAPYVAAQALANATDKKEAIVGQMWIYCYNQPIKMWDWWRLTGYPKIVEVKTPADRPTGLYWMKPSTRTAGNPLEFPRRGALPQPKPINNVNYNAARDELMTQPNYGSTYGATTGRIFWDK